MALWYPLDNPRVTGEFGNSPEFYAQFGQLGHNGIDYGYVGIGTPVYAADNGIVDFEGWGQNHSWMGSIAGICVLIRHNWGYTGYAHLNSTVVNRGQAIDRGQLLGYTGQTGVGTGAHLHFETLPANPNFSNGYAGRVNPNNYGLEPRGGQPAPEPILEQDDDMYSVVDIKDIRSGYLWNMATGETRGIDNSDEWSQLTKNLKIYEFGNMAAFEAFKNKYPFRVSISSGTVNADAVAIAKAVNDDAARRMQS